MAEENKKQEEKAPEAPKSAEEKQAHKEKISRLASEVLSGKRGIGAARKRSLRTDHDEVMKEVRRIRLQGGSR